MVISILSPHVVNIDSICIYKFCIELSVGEHSGRLAAVLHLHLVAIQLHAVCRDFQSCRLHVFFRLRHSFHLYALGSSRYGCFKLFVVFVYFLVGFIQASSHFGHPYLKLSVVQSHPASKSGNIHSKLSCCGIGRTVYGEVNVKRAVGARYVYRVCAKGYILDCDSGYVEAVCVVKP